MLTEKSVKEVPILEILNSVSRKLNLLFIDDKASKKTR